MTYLAEVLMSSDRPWLTVIVDYVNFVGYCFNIVRLRPELCNLAKLVGGASVRASIARVQSGSKSESTSISRNSPGNTAVAGVDKQRR